ncbi:MAG: hypothetical protein D6B25_08300 [Desulfobulbaceae bacterium]|nr:MAG: hypothetical protein D6B25_08300 [Desulfobulbaceae bacterium]
MRIVTINTWKGDGQYARRLKLMTDGLQQVRPDIVCLQEALRSSDHTYDTATILADALDMDHVYGPSRYKPREIAGKTVQCHSGLAILSVYPIHRSWVDTLVEHPDDPDRIGLSAQLMSGDDLIMLTNLHLTHIVGQDEHRFKQLKTVIAQNSDAARGSHWFCCGDLNFEFDPTQPTMNLNGEDVEPIDCYRAGGGTLPGGTLSLVTKVSKQRRIDYILYLKRSPGSLPDFKDATRVLTRADQDGCYASDHFGVAVDTLLP